LRLLVCTSLALVGAAAAVAAPHWTYGGEEGPEHWGSLSGEFANCAVGKQQSPIDLAGAAMKDLPNPQIAYQPTAAHLTNNGHTVQVDVDRGSTLTLDGAPFALEQFHFHSPSEHTVNGSSFPAELHFVHRAENGALAVVGVLIQVGAENASLGTLETSMPSKAGKDARVAGPLDLTTLLPSDRRAFRYSGSLTTPPCTEGVSWVVMQQPITASVAQIAMLARVLQGNSRPVQPRGERDLLLDSSP
jgi:carbonic anhydrase